MSGHFPLFCASYSFPNGLSNAENGVACPRHVHVACFQLGGCIRRWPVFPSALSSVLLHIFHYCPLSLIPGGGRKGNWDSLSSHVMLPQGHPGHALLPERAMTNHTFTRSLSLSLFLSGPISYSVYSTYSILLAWIRTMKKSCRKIKAIVK